jgi:tRNA nucleotidyltransferase (CCA-adding enzyme)
MHAYPQVDARAAGLVNLRVVPAPKTASVRDGLALLRKRQARALVGPGQRGLILLADLSRAAALGLDALPATALETPVSMVRADAPEVTVRRALLSGARAVLVMDRVSVVGAVDRSAVPALARPGMSMAARLERRLVPEVLALLAEVGRIAAAAGAPAYAVGGLVRDALIETLPGPARPAGDSGRRDMDVVVVGDGVSVARRIARALGARLTTHAAFGTASLEGLAGGRLDLVTARAERYQVPGALPSVRPGTILQDLERRDFSVNAMAIELASGTFGLLDPLGGRGDLERRRLRVLHPLSFVEDPTRIFRAARYAGRLRFALDSASRRARALALRLAPYQALTGQRIAAEIERTLAEAAPGVVLRQLGVAGAFRLVDARLRFSRAAAARLTMLGEAILWSQRYRLGARPLELAALAVVTGHGEPVVAAALRRLGFGGEPLARLRRAGAETPALLARLAGMPPGSGRASVLRDRSAVELGWAWLTGGPEARAALTWYVERAASVRPELRGDDLVELGVPRGPALGAMLRRLRDARLDGRAETRGHEVLLVRQWIDESKSIVRKER